MFIASGYSAYFNEWRETLNGETTSYPGSDSAKATISLP